MTRLYWLVRLAGFLRHGLAAFVAALLLALLSGGARAQYLPIPNYTGIGAGRQFRGDINNHLSGVAPISPRIVSLPFASLPGEQDGQQYYCKDCAVGIPCASGGNGALAVGIAGQWACGSKGGIVPPAGDLTGTPTAPVVSTVLNGKAPLYSGQIGAQLAVTTGGIAVRSTSSEASASVTSQAVSAPAGLANNDVEMACFNWEGGTPAVASIVQPTGWSAIGTPQTGTGANTATSQCAYHVVTNAAGEPATYTWSWTNAAYMAGGIVDLTGVNTTTPIDVNSGGNAAGGGGNTVTVAAMTPANQNDFVVAIAGQYAGTDAVAPNVPGAVFQINLNGNGTLVYSYKAPVAGAIASYTVTFADAAARASSVSQAALIPAATAANVPALNGAAAAPASLVASGTFPYSTATDAQTGYSADGRYNVVSYGADPSGGADSTAAIQAAEAAACTAAGLGGAMPTVFFPAGTYKILSGPVVDNCASSIMFAGVSASSSVLNGAIGGGNAQTPLLLIYPSTMLANLGTITAAPLVGGTGNSFNFPNAAVTVYWNLDDVMRYIAATPLNGLAAFDVEAFISPSFARSSDQTYTIWASSGCDVCEPLALPNTGTDAGAGQLFLTGTSGANTISGQLKIGGTVHTFSGTANVAANTTHFVEVSYDGTNIRLMLDGKLIGVTAATGTLTQRVDETEVLGGHNSNGWPDDGATSEQYTGALFSFQISKVARSTCAGSTTIGATCYTTPAAAESGDANSLLLLNGDGFNATYGTMGVDYLNGLSGISLGSFLTQAKLVPRGGTALTQGAAPLVRDLTLTNAAAGLMVIAAPQWKAEELTVTNMSHAGVIAYGNSYSGATQNLSMNGAGIVGVENDAVSSEVNYNLQITGGEYAATNPEKLDKLIWTPSASGLAGVVWHMQTNTSEAMCIDCLMDVENGGSAVPFKVISAGAPAIIVGGEMQTNGAGNVEGMDIYGNAMVTLTGVTWQGGTPAEILNFESGSTGARAVWENPVLNGSPWTRASAIPISNQMGQTTVLTGAGVINPCSGTVALTSGSPSTATVTNACVTTRCQCSDQTSASAIKCAPTAGTSLALTGPNTVTDTIAWECQ